MTREAALFVHSGKVGKGPLLTVPEIAKQAVLCARGSNPMARREPIKWRMC
jgi:hypothetical protein